MQKISFGNRDYVKASDIAKRFKYTQDYVGQLCRNDKVDARLVGRVWYVNPESVTEYRKTKHATQKTAAVSGTPTPTKPKRRLVVEPPVRAKTARQLQQAFPNDARKAIHHVVASYSRDRTSIIPVLNTTKTTTPVAVPPLAKVSPKVTIKVRPNTKKSTAFGTEKMPEITLQSKLKVSDQFENLVPATRPKLVPSLAVEITEVSNSIPVTPVRAESTAPRRTAAIPTTITIPRSGANVIDKSAATGTRQSRVSGYVSACLVLFIVTIGVLSLGVGHYNESAGSVANSGLFFSLDQVVEILLSLRQ